jgi:hypothetical protein
MNIYEINDSSNTKVIDILKNGITKSMFRKEELFENYLYEYKNNPGNLFSMLERGQFKDGSYFVITDDQDNFIAGCGWYKYNGNTALVLVRMLVRPDHRTTYVVGHKVLPIILERTEHYNNVWITCNDYNKAIYDWFDRSSKGKSPALYNNWPNLYKKFKPIGKQLVNGLQQYVAALEK